MNTLKWAMPKANPYFSKRTVFFVLMLLGTSVFFAVTATDTLAEPTADEQIFAAFWPEIEEEMRPDVAAAMTTAVQQATQQGQDSWGGSAAMVEEWKPFNVSVSMRRNEGDFSRVLFVLQSQVAVRYRKSVPSLSSSGKILPVYWEGRRKDYPDRSKTGLTKACDKLACEHGSASGLMMAGNLVGDVTETVMGGFWNIAWMRYQQGCEILQQQSADGFDSSGQAKEYADESHQEELMLKQTVTCTIDGGAWVCLQTSEDRWMPSLAEVLQAILVQEVH